jgi:hypothetical protein
MEEAGAAYYPGSWKPQDEPKYETREINAMLDSSLSLGAVPLKSSGNCRSLSQTDNSTSDQCNQQSGDQFGASPAWSRGPRLPPNLGQYGLGRAPFPQATSREVQAVGVGGP